MPVRYVVFSGDVFSKLKDTIKDALAGGADEAVILIDPLFNNLSATVKPKYWQKQFKKLVIDVLMVGEGSTDNYSVRSAPGLRNMDLRL